MIQVFGSQQFSYLDGQLTSEASDLGMKPGEVFQAIYNDACDQGMYVRSHLSGKLAPFTLEEEMKDASGELVGWKFKAARPHQSMLRYGECARFSDYSHLTAVVFND